MQLISNSPAKWAPRGFIYDIINYITIAIVVLLPLSPSLILPDILGLTLVPFKNTPRGVRILSIFVLKSGAGSLEKYMGGCVLLFY